MNIKVPASELNRMMKALAQCVDPKDQYRSNIEIIYDNNMLTARGTDGQFSAVMSTPLLGGDGESFCVDGSLFARVCSMCSGDVTITTDGKTCTVKGAGRTRLPIINAKIPEFKPVSGSTISIPAAQFAYSFNAVEFAIATDQTRLVLTGVHMEESGNKLTMTTLDGFKMASDSQMCDCDDITMVVPGAFMKMIRNNTAAGETITVTTDGKRIQAETEGMILSSTLLANEYPDYKRILPTEFKTEVLIDTEPLRNALKNSSVICDTKMVKMIISGNKLTVTGNSDKADYEADIDCEQQGPDITIAFNQKYLVSTINSVSDDKIVLKFNAPVNPCVIGTREGSGFRLILPVRNAG